MASNITDLPNEVFDRIFSHLAENRQEIGVCRLVCRLFKQLSSPYLITRVVFARRLTTLLHLREVIEHEYFHKYVTELILDASNYEESLAGSCDDYVHECKLSYQRFADPECSQKILQAQKQWRELDEYRSAGRMRLSVRKLEYDRRLDGKAEASSSHLPRRDGMGEDGTSSSEEDHDTSDRDFSSSSGDDEEMTPGSNPNDLPGCYRSFPDYWRLFNAQCRLDRHRTVPTILEDLFSRLPRLTSVVFTDWRSLARPTETYSDCARRLFGNVLAPTMVVRSLDAEEVLYDLMDSFVPPKGTQIQEFSTGSHAFQNDHVINFPTVDHRNPIYIPSEWLDSVDRFTLMAGLRRLDLKLAVSEADGIILSTSQEAVKDNGLQRILAAASHLEHLILATRFFGRAELRASTEHETIGALVFQAWLGTQHFPGLQTLELRGMILPILDFEAFLQRHQPSLRRVTLHDCHITGHHRPLVPWDGCDFRMSEVTSDTGVTSEDLRAGRRGRACHRWL